MRNYPKVRKARTPKMFCKYGHDMAVSGRSNRGRCLKCRNGNNWGRDGIINKDGSKFTPIDYDRHYQIQQGRCFICKRHQTELSRSLCVDHDHKTNRFRSLLCDACNIALGYYEKIGAVAEKYLKDTI